MHKYGYAAITNKSGHSKMWLIVKICRNYNLTCHRKPPITIGMCSSVCNCN